MAKKDFGKGEIVIYQTPKNEIELKVRLEKETVWLTQTQIALLFGTQRPAITKHLSNTFKCGELNKKSVSSILEHTAADGKTGERKINDNALTALALLIAVSDPKDKDALIKIIINLLSDEYALRNL